MRKARVVSASIALTVAIGTAAAQEKPVTSFEVQVPEGAALFRSDASPGYPPVWCGPNIVAIPGGEVLATGVRRWIRYFDLERRTFADEVLDDKEGAIVACSVDGSKRLTVIWETDAQTVGEFSLVSADSKRTTKLLDATAFLSADGNLRTFVFADRTATWPNWSGTLQLVTAGGPAPNSDVSRTQKFGNAAPASVSIASISPDGDIIAYSVRTVADPSRWDDPSALDIVISPFGQQTGVRLAVDELLKGADKLKSFSFDHDKLMVVGKSDDNKLVVKLVVATCSVKTSTPRNCRSALTELDADKVSVLGLGETGPIFGNIDYSGGSRVCIFESPEGKLRDMPSSCRMEGPSARVYGQYAPDVFFVLSPDRRHAAVLSKYRAPPNDRMATVSEWAVVPVARYRTR